MLSDEELTEMERLARQASMSRPWQSDHADPEDTLELIAEVRRLRQLVTGYSCLNCRLDDTSANTLEIAMKRIDDMRATIASLTAAGDAMAADLECVSGNPPSRYAWQKATVGR